MLCNDNIYKSRDASTAQQVAELMALKYFDEQFLYYGLAYAQDGVIKYRLHEKPEPIYRFFADSAQNGLCPTGISQYVQLVKVPSGQEAAAAAQVQDAFLAQLQAAYPPALFQALTRLGAVPATDEALALLLAYQDQLELCFDGDAIGLFRGLCQMAYASKRLTAPAFAQLTQWAQQRAELIDSCENVIWRGKRYFHGFLYWPDGQRRLYANASLTCVMHQAYTLQAAGVPCTPIHSKHYWFDAHKGWSITKWRSQFAADLTHLMDPEALQRFQALRQLPSPISAQQLQKARRAIDSQRYPLAAQVLAYYDSLWG